MGTQYPWLMLGDCLERMKEIPDCSVDMILCDLPYGTTACKWDVVIPFEPLWEQYWRVSKSNAAIVLFGSEPFTFRLGMSQIEKFRYCFSWIKSKASNFQHARKMPMKRHENILVFYRHLPTFNLVDLQQLDNPIFNSRKNKGANLHGSKIRDSGDYFSTETGFTFSDLYFANPSGKGHLHPTQKPVPLLEYLVNTYTNENEIVLDNTMGSGSTGVACVNTSRRFIGIEKDSKYFAIAESEIERAVHGKNQLLFA